MGVLVAMSVLQGQPGFPVLLLAVFEYIVSGEYSAATLTEEDAPDYEVKSLLANVWQVHIHYQVTHPHPFVASLSVCMHLHNCTCTCRSMGHNQKGSVSQGGI